MSASSKIVTVLALAEDQLQLSMETRTNTIFQLTWLMYEFAFCLVYFCSTFSFSRHFALLKIVMTFAIKLGTNEINMWTFTWIHQCGWGCTYCACQPATFCKRKDKIPILCTLSQFIASGKNGEKRSELKCLYLREETLGY